MKMLEVVAGGQKLAFALIPLAHDESEKLGLTKAARESAKLFGYDVIAVVNRDRLRAWRGDAAAPSLDLDTRIVLAPYASGSMPLESAGESVLSGLVERWLADLRQHWRHPSGKVPGENEARAVGFAVGEAASAST